MKLTEKDIANILDAMTLFVELLKIKEKELETVQNLVVRLQKLYPYLSSIQELLDDEHLKIVQDYSSVAVTVIEKIKDYKEQIAELGMEI